jgi:hypothetical protein
VFGRPATPPVPKSAVQDAPALRRFRTLPSLGGPVSENAEPSAAYQLERQDQMQQFPIHTIDTAAEASKPAL